MDALDLLANDAFAGRVVRKELVRQVKVGANVPVYVLEFLLGKYCASDDEAAIATGLQVVNQTLTENFIRPDESQKAQANLKRKGQHRLIDKVTVRLVASEDKYWAELANFGDKFIHVPEDFVYRYDRLLQGGVWCQVELIYNADEEELHKRPFFIKGLKPIQVAAFELDEFTEARRRFTGDQWLDLLVRSVGLEASQFDWRTKMLYITRLIPMVERNYNLIELGPWGTGKSFVYRETSPNSILISGGKTTVPQLFVNMGTGRVGLVGTWDVVAFDEVAGIQFSDTTVIQILKDFMESGSFARGKEEIPAEASIVFLGNTSKPPQELVRSAHLFADLPKAMIDPAFLDRLHFYIPGWETPKMEQLFLASHFGFVSDYLAEALRELRKRSHVSAIDEEFLLGSHLSTRDERAVRKTVSGLLKILHPHGEWTHSELREYLEFGLEGRRRVKEQLKKLAPHDYSKTSFSYLERASGLEQWVDVREQPEDLEERLIALTSEQEDGVAEPSHRPLAELIKLAESSTLEFKQSARWSHIHGDGDKVSELEVVKNVAGFMNARGGTLVIGVSDEHEPVGLRKDFKSIQGRPDADGFENWLTNVFQDTIGKPTIAQLSIGFEPVDDQDLCRIDVAPSPTPVFVSWKGESQFYVRLNNSTRQLNMSEYEDYRKRRWLGL